MLHRTLHHSAPPNLAAEAGLWVNRWPRDRVRAFGDSLRPEFFPTAQMCRTRARSTPRVNERPRAASRVVLTATASIHSPCFFFYRPPSVFISGTLFMFFALFSALLAAFDRLLLNAGLTLGSPVRRLLRRRQARLAAASDGGSQTHFSLDAELSTSAKRPILLYFHSSGLFLPYYIGVAEYLKAHYDCSDIMCAGVSGGYAGASSIVSSAIRLRMKVEPTPGLLSAVRSPPISSAAPLQIQRLSPMPL